jgi:hypothetical protein
MQSVIFSYSNTSRLIKNQKNPADLGRKSGLLDILYERRLSKDHPSQLFKKLIWQRR